MPATAHHDPRGGPRSPVGRHRRGVATGGPGVGCVWGWSGYVSSLIPVPFTSYSTPRTCSESRRYTHGDAKWPPSGRSPRKAGPSGLPWRTSKTGDLRTTTPCPRWATFRGPCSSCSPPTLAAAVRREPDSCERLRVGWQAIADGTLLALFLRDVADGYQSGALFPDLARHHTYMTTPPGVHPRRRQMTSPQPSRTTGSSLTTGGRRSGRRRSAGTTNAAFTPAC